MFFICQGGLSTVNLPKVDGEIYAVAYDSTNDFWYIGGNFSLCQADRIYLSRKNPR